MVIFWMNYQMKSRRQPREVCSCGDVCPCHGPEEGWSDGFIVFLALLVIGSLIGGAACLARHKPETKPTIEVEGRMCDVVFRQDGITSTGAAYGHNVAVCHR